MSLLILIGLACILCPSLTSHSGLEDARFLTGLGKRSQVPLLESRSGGEFLEHCRLRVTEESFLQMKGSLKQNCKNNKCALQHCELLRAQHCVWHTVGILLVPTRFANEEETELSLALPPSLLFTLIAHLWPWEATSLLGTGA